MLIPHSKPYFDKSEEIAVRQVIRSGYIAMGKKVIEFEEKLAKVINKKFAVCLDSGFSAIRLSLLAINIQKNDKVGFPMYSCVAIINAILSVGAIPVPFDNYFSGNTIDVENPSFIDLKALIVVHTFGDPVNIKKIKEKTNIPIIEDCAHAFGRKLYSYFGDIVVLSFYATKLIGIGEGGAILTNVSSYKEKIIEFRSYVDQQPSRYKFNNKMTDIEGALGVCQLKKLMKIIEKRDHLATAYYDSLSVLEQYGVRLPKFSSDRIWYRYVLSIPENKMTNFKHYLNLQGICAEIPIYCSVKSLDDYPNARLSFCNNLSIPIYPGLTEIEQNFIIKHMKKYFYANRR